MGKGELSDQGPGIQCVPARDPEALLGTSARIRENPGWGEQIPLCPCLCGPWSQPRSKQWEAGSVLVLTNHQPTVQIGTITLTSLDLSFPVCEMTWSG